MRDPLDELRNLTGHVSAHPLPSAEVRRRGDRMRRRRTLVHAVGAAAAVAVVVSGGAFVTGNLTTAPVPPGPAERTGSPTPSPTAEAPQQAWLTSIPDGFPIGRGLPKAGGDVPPWEWSQDARTALDAESCGGTGQETVDPVDGQRVQVEPPDEQAWRHLLLFEDDTSASRMLDRARSADGRCLADLQGHSSTDDGLVEVRWSVEETVRGPAPVVVIEGRAYAQGTETRVPGRSLTRVAQIGNALLVAHASDASSADGEDSTTRAFSADVATVIDEMCIFAADPCGGDAPGESAEDDSPSYLLGPEDLGAATGMSGWEVVDAGLDPPFLCAEEYTETLGGDRTDTVRFAVGTPDRLEAQAVTMVMDFDPPLTSAADGYSRAVRWLESCEEPLDPDHRVFSAGDAYGDLHTGKTEHGPWSWRTVMSTAPEVCRECDAGWNNHQAALSSGGRLVMIQVSYRADLQSSVDEADTPFPALIRAAARLSARHPADSASATTNLTLGPATLGPIGIAMSLEDLKGLVRGTPRHCTGFDAVDLPRPIDGYASRTRGVEAIFAGPPAQTPEGVGFLNTQAEVEEVYGELTPSSVRLGWLAPVPGHSDLSYSFAFDETGQMTEMALLQDSQECFG